MNRANATAMIIIIQVVDKQINSKRFECEIIRSEWMSATLQEWYHHIWVGIYTAPVNRESAKTSGQAIDEQ